MSDLGVISPVNAVMHEHDRQVAIEELRYIIRHRDEIADKIRFGLIGLNGASLLALLSALGGEGQAASWLGFTAHNALNSAIAFTVGLVLTGYAIMSQQNLTTTEAGDASARAQTLNRLVALYRQPVSAENHDRLGAAMNDYQALPLTGFQFRKRVLFAQNFAAAAWVYGISVPLISVIQDRLGTNITWPWWQ